ncbi:MAG: hypothetical protein IPO32_20350 [Crocinitomicaceae bacterium]|nr:hypothetical protein [Crocinitomicaceae bacterium]
MNGIWKYYYPNGKIQEEGPWVNSVQHGSWNYYNKSGKLEETRLWENGKATGKPSHTDQGRTSTK